MVRGLTMLSVDTREVSNVPGRPVCSSWVMMLCSSPDQLKARSSQRYCEPTVEFRFFQVGCSGPAPVGPHQALIHVVVLVGVVALRIPVLARRLVEIRI